MVDFINIKVNSAFVVPALPVKGNVGCPLMIKRWQENAFRNPAANGRMTRGKPVNLCIYEKTRLVGAGFEASSRPETAERKTYFASLPITPS